MRTKFDGRKQEKSSSNNNNSSDIYNTPENLAWKDMYKREARLPEKDMNPLSFTNSRIYIFSVFSVADFIVG
jgi:hypothetical protein